MTRATIKFTDGKHTFYARKYADGYPDGVLPDISRSIKQAIFDSTNPNNSIHPDVTAAYLFDIFINLCNRVENYAIHAYCISDSFHQTDEYRYTVRRVDGEWVYKKPRRRSYNVRNLSA